MLWLYGICVLVWLALVDSIRRQQTLVLSVLTKSDWFSGEFSFDLVGYSKVLVVKVWIVVVVVVVGREQWLRKETKEMTSMQFWV